MPSRRWGCRAGCGDSGAPAGTGDDEWAPRGSTDLSDPRSPLHILDALDGRGDHAALTTGIRGLSDAGAAVRYPPRCARDHRNVSRARLNAIAC